MRSARPPRLRSRAALPALPAIVLARRGFFGLGEIAGVLANPAETVRSLTESKKLLQEARQELKDNQERSQIPPKHTFSPLPGFFGRTREIRAIERALAGTPNFTVLFGASSVGKTALLREILSRDAYHCLHFDLRIAGFADLASLYHSLSTQMEQYFAALPDLYGESYREFEKESWAFKHDRAAMDQRIEKGGQVKTSDISHVMELFQSSLLKYWNFEPTDPDKDKKEETKNPKGKQVEQPKPRQVQADEQGETSSKRSATTATSGAQEEATEAEEKEKEWEPPVKRIPVFFLDEAHKLPALIQADDAMKIILDAFLVLTKQDRLCHCVHATSDPYYMTYLRQENVAQHAKILSIGDCDREETKRYYEEHLLPDIPDELRERLPSFDEIFKVYGGKLAHWQDYIADFVNADGKLSTRGSSHYLQAYALLNLHLIHASASKDGDDAEAEGGLQIYSSLFTGSQHAAPAPGSAPSTSSRDDLIAILKALQADEWQGTDYFPLCRELGAAAVDGAVRGRLCELRWTPSVTPEGTGKQFIQPVIVPITPVVRLAMEDVLKELSL